MATPSLDIACVILAFCPWPDRGHSALWNKYWGQAIFGSDRLWAFFAERLAAEHHLYVPRVCPLSGWRTFFLTDLWPLRGRWRPVPPADPPSPPRPGHTPSAGVAAPQQATPPKFHVRVVARFRPTAAAAGEGGPEDATLSAVRLPLHQRLQLLRRQHHCSTDRALQRLFGRGHHFFDRPFVGLHVVRDSEDNDSAERQGPSEAAAAEMEDAGSEFPTGAGVVALGPSHVVVCAPGVGLREFGGFAAVHAPDRDAGQPRLYDTVGRRQVLHFLNGANCTVLCYGQTASGKTFTLFGPDPTASCALPPLPFGGVVPRACAEVCAAVADLRARGVLADLRVAYVEVFGDQVTDLLQEGSAVGAWQGTAARAVLDGAPSVSVESAVALASLLLRGDAAKRRAATLMNERSSRAHALLFLTLDQQVGEVHGRSTLCFADLGGCEQLKKSGAQGERLQEAIHINTGLLALKRCITSLNDGARYVPYQDSKLTLLLRPALGGDSRTVVVVTCSADPQHATETLQALRFGEQCAAVQNNALARVSCVGGLLAALDAEIALCRDDIRAKERWETTAVVVGVDSEQGEERATKSRLVGAEAEHQRLDALLRRRRRLLGEPEVSSSPERPKKRRVSRRGPRPAASAARSASSG